MRSRTVWDRRTRRTWLEVKPGHGEDLDDGRMWTLGRSRSRVLLLPEPGDSGEQTVRFDVTSLVALGTFARRDVVSHQRYERMLASVAEGVADCRALGMDESVLLLDQRDVFVSLDGSLRLAAVPLAGGEGPSRTTVVGLLASLGRGGRLRFGLEEDERIASDLRAFCDVRDDFDLDGYCTFLSHEFGMAQHTLLRPGAAHEGKQMGARGDDSSAVDAGPGAEPVWTSGSIGDGGVSGVGGACRPLGEGMTGCAGGRRADRPMPAVSQGLQRGEDRNRSDAVPKTLLFGRVGKEHEGRRGTTPVLDGGDVDGVPEGEPPASREAAPAAYELVRLRTGRHYPLAADETIVVGRSSECGLQLLGNPDISRRHAVLLAEGDGCVVGDLGSANGTSVRGHELGPSESARVALEEPFRLAGEPFMVVRLDEEGESGTSSG